MQVIVISCGKVGAKLVKVLSEEGHDVVIVDSDSNAFKSLGPSFNGVTVTGVPIDQDVLKQAGIESADAVVAVTPDDNVNIMVCQVAKEIFRVPRVIARIYNPSREHVFHQFGLETICPTNITVSAIHSMLQGENEVNSQSMDDMTFIYRHQKTGREMDGMRLDAIETGENSSIFGVMRNGKFTFAKPDLRISAGDVLIIAERAD